MSFEVASLFKTFTANITLENLFLVNVNAQSLSRFFGWILVNAQFLFHLKILYIPILSTNFKGLIDLSCEFAVHTWLFEKNFKEILA